MYSFRISVWVPASIAALPMSEMIVQLKRLLHSTRVGAPETVVERTHT